MVFLAEEPSAQAMETLMAESLEHPVVIRLPQSVLDRADAVKDKAMKKRPHELFGRVSRAAVLRLALLRGLESLEAEYDVPQPPTSEPRDERRRRTK